MSESRLALQLYTLRDSLKTPADIASTLHRVKAIGYENVEIAGLGPIPVRDLRRILDGEGLQACGGHVPFARLQSDLEAVVDEYHVLGCPNLGIPIAPDQYRNGEGCARFAREATVLARRLAESDLRLYYHNHAWEMERYEGRTGMEILFDDSDPGLFLGEIDTYWIQYGGGDPAAWIRRYKGRQPLVHLKDMAIVENRQVMAEIGEGNLNWPDVLQACVTAGVTWYVVEQDWCQRDPFEAVEISLRNLRAMGLQ